MTISLKLLDSVSDIEQKINSATADHINGILSRSVTRIENRIKNLVYQWIELQPEMASITDDVAGSLAGQFGIPDVNRAGIVASIIKSVVDSTQVKFTKFNKKLTSGGITIYVQPENFGNLLSLPTGFVFYDNGSLHWLNWLLKGGDGIIIVGYEYNPKKGIGRSGLGNMIEGGSFRVPPQFSGTQDDNFITRALIGKKQEEQITQIFKDIIL